MSGIFNLLIFMSSKTLQDTFLLCSVCNKWVLWCACFLPSCRRVPRAQQSCSDDCMCTQCAFYWRYVDDNHLWTRPRSRSSTHRCSSHHPLCSMNEKKRPSFQKAGYVCLYYSSYCRRSQVFGPQMMKKHRGGGASGRATCRCRRVMLTERLRF